MGQRGSVTAETALVAPVLVALVFGLLWVVSLGITQARCLDAAREAARALARDDSTAVALTLARRSAPAGAHVRFERDGAVAVVTVSVSTAPPGPVFAALPTVEVSAHAVSALETSR
jgi:Flp pilus assembly protein TadG